MPQAMQESTGSTLRSDWQGLKSMAAEWCRAVDANAPMDSLDNGFKCLTLLYFGLECSALDRNQAEHLIRMACRKMIDLEIRASIKRDAAWQQQLGRLVQH